MGMTKQASIAVTVCGAALALAACGSASSTSVSAQRTVPTPAASASSSASPRTLPGGSLASPLPPASASASSCPSSSPSSVRVEDADTPEAVPALASVEFVSADAGWAVGAGRILATSDGGRAWRSQYDGPARFYQVDFIDARHGWAVGTNSLMVTSDGGQTWTGLTEPCGLADSVHFVSPTRGYAIAGGSDVRLDGGVPVPVNGGSLLMTANGGQSWSAVPGAPAAAQVVCFANASDGFLGTPGKIWRSTDGGSHWSVSFAEPPKSASIPKQAGDTPALECAGPDAAWVDFLGFGAAMSNAPYIAYATQDAVHWHVLFEEGYTESAVYPQVHAPNGPGSYPGPFSAISPDSAAFFGWDPPEGFGAVPMDIVTGGSLAKVSDVGGLTEAYAAAFISATQGWVIGTDQTSAGQSGADAIESTSNGGHTWTRQYTTSS